MITRKITQNVLDGLRQFPVVSLLGPRQVGKTTLAKQIAKQFKKVVYLDLELISDLNKLSEPEDYLKQHEDKLVIIDEIQRMPELFSLIRALVDQKRVPSRFLILGSASPDLIRHASDSLAGRVLHIELTPFLLTEVGDNKMDRLWLRGGFPESFLAQDQDQSMLWRESFIRNFLERDISNLGIKVSSNRLRNFWLMLAHDQGQLWNASHIARSLGVSAPTVESYLDILEDTFVVRRLRPYFANSKKRLVKSPKIYIRDAGLLHSLLSIKTHEVLQGHPVIGYSWEGFIIEQIIAMLPYTWQYYFYRTAAGAETDLVLINDQGDKIAIEIKRSFNPVVSQGFYNSIEDIEAKRAYVIYGGDELIYRSNKKIILLPVYEMAAIIQ